VAWVVCVDAAAGSLNNVWLESQKYHRQQSGKESTMSQNELLACPFCGSREISDGEVLTGDGGKTYTQSECQNCGALGPRGYLENGEADLGDLKAIAAWNRRAAIPAAPVQQTDVAHLYMCNQETGRAGWLCTGPRAEIEAECDRLKALGKDAFVRGGTAEEAKQ
jgi:Lar family restriction alleviation protein